MSQASIDSVQSWLSFELEQRGIDAVVYARHILNLFLSSHFTTDLHLAKKEASIFARLPPGPNKLKLKQKYRKRSSSFPFLDEVALKKEMAAECLRSAADEIVKDSDGESIDSLIEDLYDKLSSLNLLSGSGSNSDVRRVGKPKEKYHETYHDAFPLLFNMPENATKVNNQLDTVWNGQPIFKKRNQIPEESTQNDRENLVESGNNDKFQRTARWASSKNSPQQLKFNGRNKKLNSPRRCSRRRLHPFDSAKKSPRSYKPKSFYQQRKKDRWECDKENSNEPKPNYALSRKMNKLGSKVNKSNSQPQVKRSFFDNAGTIVKNGHWIGADIFSSNTNGNSSSFCENTNVSSCEKDISHLYSMGLPDFYKSPNSDDAPSSKWFRDPQSGCLEFEPAYKNRSSSDTSPSSVESWLWCPSPSLWDDSEESSLQSRFETIYKPPIRSNSDSQASQLWKDYEAIFTEVARESLASPASKSDDVRFPVIDSNNNESYSVADFVDKVAPVEQVQPLSAGQHDAHQLFVQDDDCVSDLEGLFGRTPSITTVQSRREIWLKNSEALKKEKQSLFLLGDEFNSSSNELPIKGHSTLASWLHLDEFLCDLSFQIRECCNLHWLFGWDMPEDPYSFSIPTELPFSDSRIQFSQLQNIYSDTLSASLEVGRAGGFEDDVFGGNLFAPSEVEKLPWKFFLEEASDPVAFFSDAPSAQQPPKPDINASSSLEDCITENQAWKSSLRIGHMWQSISGIRRVNVIYSEKQDANDQTPLLPPSSCTHFRPIHDNELDVSVVNAGSVMLEHGASDSVDILQSATGDLTDTCFSSPKLQHTCDGCSDCDMKIRGLEQDLDNLLCDVTPKVAPQTSSETLPKFQKVGEDKSMQTTFEEHIRQIKNGICESLSIRPPKANSR